MIIELTPEISAALNIVLNLAEANVLVKISPRKTQSYSTSAINK